MKVLVTGANGLLGQHLIKQLIENNFDVIGTGKGVSRIPIGDYKSADLSDEEEINKVIEDAKPNVIIHAGAMTQVDECELDHESCDRTNIKGTINVIKAAESFAEHLIYVSTDFVFDGIKGNYSEDDQPTPINYYGKTKLRAEELVRHSSLDWSIVRTCLVYGTSLVGTRGNIITWVKQNLEQHKKIKVVNDQIRTPTYVEDLAKGIVLVVEKRAKGVYHVSGNEFLTPYQMAMHTADFFRLDKNLIEEVDASSFTQAAKRPARTGFDISKATTELDYRPVTFNEGLRKMFKG